MEPAWATEQERDDHFNREIDAQWDRAEIKVSEDDIDCDPGDCNGYRERR